MIDLNIRALSRAYRDGTLQPGQVVEDILRRCRDFEDRNIWITLLDTQQLLPYLERLEALDPKDYPLWGIPFAIKDNIDLGGVDTTAACPDFRYRPRGSAPVVERLVAAGAIPIGKTNLDQFATGLVGTRSPYGECKNAFDPAYISGGSSAGSAVAVALGLASFALGTDTAGSGRVPAGLNNLIGLKPSRGLLPTTGVVPACRSLDCVSIFALTADDANTVLTAAQGVDEADPYSRPNPYGNGPRHYGRWSGPLRAAVIRDDQLAFFGHDGYARAYRRTLERLVELGVEPVQIDYAPFLETARLLYEGPWVAERYLATLPLIRDEPEALLEVTRAIIAPGGEPRATDLFRALYRLEALKKTCLAQLERADCLLTPTCGRPFTRAEIAEQPIVRNSQLGHYTNFLNLLDLCAVALPAAFTDQGLPFGITLVGRTFEDRRLLAIANRLQWALNLSPGAVGLPLGELESRPVGDNRRIEVLVCGAHLEGLPLNWQLTERGGRLEQRTYTAPHYRFYALPGGPPLRPGLVRVGEGGAAIEVEIWSLPSDTFGSFVAGIPAPLGIGRVDVSDGREVSGFICEPRAVEGARDITALGGWRAYLSGRQV